jgi:hypothetical protein
MAAKQSMCLPAVPLLAVGDEPYSLIIYIGFVGNVYMWKKNIELDDEIQNNYQLEQKYLSDANNVCDFCMASMQEEVAAWKYDTELYTVINF